MIRVLFQCSCFKFNKSHNFKCCISLILSIISIVFSLIVLSKSIPRIFSSTELQFDYIGAIIGVLSILVTILLGWQIYNVLEINKKVNDVGDKYKKVLNDEISKAVAYTNAITIFTQGVMVLSNNDTSDYAVAYEHFALAMSEYIKADNDIDKNINNCIDNMDETLKKEKWNNNYDYGKTEQAITNVFESGKLSRDQIERILETENNRKEKLSPPKSK